MLQRTRLDFLQLTQLHPQHSDLLDKLLTLSGHLWLLLQLGIVSMLPIDL